MTAEVRTADHRAVATAGWRKAWISPRTALLLVPVVFVIVFFIVPLAQMLVYSFFEYDPVTIMREQFTLENYIAILIEPYQQGVLVRTVALSLATTLISAVMAYPIAMQMRRARGTGKLVLAMIVLSPIMISPIVLAFPWLILLAPNTGLVTTIMNAIGVPPPRIMFTNVGVLIGLLYAGLSFMVLSLHTSLENIEESNLLAASVLGANPAQVFVRITLPLTLPGLASGFLLVFSVSSSSFLMPYMLGGNQVPVLATYAYNMASVLLNWPSASAIAGVLVVLTLAATLGYNSWIGRLERRLGHVGN